MDGQIKVGLRNAMIILLIAIILIPMTKNGVEKLAFIPEGVKNWIRAV